MQNECEIIKSEIVSAYEDHIVVFREFVGQTGAWLANYEQHMAPMLMECLADIGDGAHPADWQLMGTLTYHAERFAKLAQAALAEYEEAYKTADAIFKKVNA